MNRPFSFDYRDYTCWEDVARRLQCSKDPAVKDHFFWGVDRTGRIQLLDRKLARMHCHFLGGTGAGKTSKAMLPLVLQTMWRKDTSVHVEDMKGDNFFCNSFIETAQRTGTPFKVLTLESDKASYGFFPLKQPFWKRLSLEERTELLMSMLSDGFGETSANDAYWMTQTENFLRAILSKYPHVDTFRELHRIANDPAAAELLGLSKRAVEHAGALVSQLARVASIPQINGGPPSVEQAAINTTDCLTTVCHTYLWLPAQLMPRTGRAVARIFSAMLSAEARSMRRAPVPQLLVTDEFQQVAQPKSIETLKQARSAAISCYLGHQNLCDLGSGGQSLADAVIGNTNVRVSLTAIDSQGKRHLKESSVRVSAYSRAASRTVTEAANGDVSLGISDSIAERAEEAVSQDVIAKVNAIDGLALVEAYPHSGKTRLLGPKLLYMPAICSPAHYLRLENAPWPAPNQFTMVGGGPQSEEPEPPQPIVVTAMDDEEEPEPSRASPPPRRERRRASPPPPPETPAAVEPPPAPEAPQSSSLARHLLQLVEGSS